MVEDSRRSLLSAALFVLYALYQFFKGEYVCTAAMQAFIPATATVMELYQLTCTR